MSQNCAKVALRGKNCALAQKRKSCAVQHRNFLGGGTKHLRLWNSTNAEANDASQYQYPAVVW